MAIKTINISEETMRQMYFEKLANPNVSYGALTKKYLNGVLTDDALRHRINNWAIKTGFMSTAANQYVYDDSPEYYQDVHENEMYEPYPSHLDDTDKWSGIKNDFFKAADTARVAVMFDGHLPDLDYFAFELFLQTCVKFNPHFLIFGGDMFDFDALSTFAKIKRRRSKDAFKEVADEWFKMQNRIDTLLPRLVARVAFRGNHEGRLDRWGSVSGNPFPDTTEENFVNIVRSNNRVMWLGAKQETSVGNWFVQHGKRVGLNAAKQALDDLGGATSQSQGHTHHPVTIYRRINNADGTSRIITSTTSGMTGNTNPHYVTDTDMTKSIQGGLFAHVSLNDVNIQNVVFHRSDNKLWTALGQDYISVDIRS